MAEYLLESLDSASQVTESLEERPTLSVVIPAYNEGLAIGAVLDSIVPLARAERWEVIVVDDGSNDGTSEEVKGRRDGRNFKLLRHTYNRGYGAAVKSGIRAATASLVATMDSDGQHDPSDLLKLLPGTRDYDLVVGRRPGLMHSPLWRVPGKWLLTWLANRLSRRNVGDLNSGMRIFRTDLIKKYLHLCSDGFSFSTTSTIAFLCRGYAVTEVPITIRRRHQEARSTVRLSTGFDTLVLILRLACLFYPLRLFIPASVVFVAGGILWGLPYVLLERGVSVGALLLILTGLLLFFFGLLADQVAQLRLEKYE
jgi:glycosyltransferase involved in cell wall biosynthesis